MSFLLTYLSLYFIDKLQKKADNPRNDKLMIVSGYLLIIPHFLLLYSISGSEFTGPNWTFFATIPFLMLSVYYIWFFCKELKDILQMEQSWYNSHCCVVILLIIILFYAICYSFTESFHAGSFEELFGSDELSRSVDFIYLSVMAFTTVGFGDIVPKTTFARGLVTSENLVSFGVLVVALNFFRGTITRETENRISSLNLNSSSNVSRKYTNKKLFRVKSIKRKERADNSPLTTEEIHKEIDLLQGCITRMANNSFFIKGWFISVYAVVLALIGEDVNFTVISLVLLWINFGFWWLDGYFLQAEKSYRNIYAWVLKKRPLGNRDFLYNLNTSCDRKDLNTPETVTQVMISPTLRVFYAVPLVCLVLFCIFRIVSSLW